MISVISPKNVDELVNSYNEYPSFDEIAAARAIIRHVRLYENKFEYNKKFPISYSLELRVDNISMLLKKLHNSTVVSGVNMELNRWSTNSKNRYTKLNGKIIEEYLYYYTTCESIHDN